MWPLTLANVPWALLVAAPFSIGMDQIERTNVTCVTKTVFKKGKK